jgi:hypothetical protein
VDKDIEAINVLARFAPQIRWVTDSVVHSFELELHFRDDVKQQAEIRIMSYADLFEVVMDGHGRLAKWIVRANGDEVQVKAMLAYQLRIDLAKDISRMIHRNGDQSMHSSLDQIQDEWNQEPASVPGETYNISQPPVEPSIDYDAIEAAMASSRYLRRFVQEFPFLAMQIIGELSIDEIRQKAGVSRATAFRRLEAERSILAPVWEYEYTLFGDWLQTLTRDELTKIRNGGLYDYLVLEVCEKITDNGRVDLLCVEGDEDLEDLVEAKTNLFAVGR